MVRGSARLSSRANWAGGYYELALGLAGRDDARLRSVARTLWRVATVEGEASFEGFPDDVDPRGVVALPGGARTVARLYAFRSFDDADDEQTSDWVCLALPLGALTRTDHRIGAFPLGDGGGVDSLVWRAALDEWLARIARDVAAVSAIRLAVIGFEAVGEVSRDDVDRNGPPAERPYALLVPGQQSSHHPATY